MSPLFHLTLDPQDPLPLYRQLSDSIRSLIQAGDLQKGDRLPATRELADHLGLNRTTVSAAYASLEESGLLEGKVGRGSFVAVPNGGRRAASSNPGQVDWNSFFRTTDPPPAPATAADISFASSRPPENCFPLAEFRRLANEVLESGNIAEILQLGSPYGYAPLRRYLLAQAQDAGIARSGDAVLVTNGCQQALDLLARLFANSGLAPLVVEDPVYHGLVRVLGLAGCTLIPVSVEESGINMDALEKALTGEGARVVIVTPSFQNPTGATLSLERRKAIVHLAQRAGALLVENDIYSELRYEGAALPTLKELDATGNTILLRSYSKIAFPGLRVGWVVGPRPVIARLAEAKQWADLHSDHLSQAILLRFAQSGELSLHLERTRRDGKHRLGTILEACGQFLPQGSRWTRPEGGMSLWVELPAPLDAENLLARTRERGVDFLPGPYFSSRPAHRRSLRLGFGGLPPASIKRGIEILGTVAREELAGHAARASLEPAMALV